MNRLGGLQLLSKFFSTCHDAFAHRSKGAGVCILGRELPKLFIGVHKCEGRAADAVQIIPELLQFAGFIFTEYQSAELVVFTIIECESDDFIDRHNSSVTQGGREEFPEAGKVVKDAFVSRAVRECEDGSIEGGRCFAVRPACLALSGLRCGCCDAAETHWAFCQHLHLNAAFAAAFGMQGGVEDKFATDHQLRRHANLHHGRGLYAEISQCGAGTGRMDAKKCGIGARKICCRNRCGRDQIGKISLHG